MQDSDQFLHDVRGMLNVAREAAKEFQRYPDEVDLLGTAVRGLDRMALLVQLAETSPEEDPWAAARLAIVLLTRSTEDACRSSPGDLRLPWSGAVEDVVQRTPRFAAAALQRALKEGGLRLTTEDGELVVDSAP